MAYFEEHGFHYAAYTIEPTGQVTRDSFRVSAPFPPLNRGPIERFTTGEVWQGHGPGGYGGSPDRAVQTAQADVF